MHGLFYIFDVYPVVQGSRFKYSSDYSYRANVPGALNERFGSLGSHQQRQVQVGLPRGTRLQFENERLFPTGKYYSTVWELNIILLRLTNLIKSKVGQYTTTTINLNNNNKSQVDDYVDSSGEPDSYHDKVSHFVIFQMNCCQTKSRRTHQTILSQTRSNVNQEFVPMSLTIRMWRQAM